VKRFVPCRTVSCRHVYTHQRTTHSCDSFYAPSQPPSLRHAAGALTKARRMSLRREGVAVAFVGPTMRCTNSLSHATNGFYWIETTSSRLVLVQHRARRWRCCVLKSSGRFMIQKRCYFNARFLYDMYQILIADKSTTEFDHFFWLFFVDEERGFCCCSCCSA
jgi:hypothetical protein